MKRTLSVFTVMVLLGLVFAPRSLEGQDKIDAAGRQAAIDSLARLMEENYVFPAVGRQIAATLRDKQAAGQYRHLTDVAAFADQLTADLRSVNNDKHLNVRFDPRMAAGMRRPPEDGPRGPSPEWLAGLKRDNFGFREVKILEGNIGYLDLRGFMPPSLAGEAAVAAMNFLANADAIIFDLRNNGGGDPAMIQLLTSYLYGEGQTRHLNNFYFRPSNDTTQTWTLPFVPGKRNAGAKVFVLTSGFTFSAAEEFTYNLKNLERATIIGETTGGGAHPGGMHPVDDRFVVFIPEGRAFNPITGTNWEGTGVEPHVKAPAEEALDKGYLMALEALAADAGDENTRRYFTWHIDALRSRLEPPTVAADILRSYAGDYGQRKLSVESGKLFYQRAGRPRMELRALAGNTFMPVDRSDFRIVIETNEGKVVALVVEYQDGRRERSERGGVTP